MSWPRVTKKNPCPICGKPDWCGVAPDGSAAICMRIESDKPTSNGGYLHRITKETAPRQPPRRFTPPPPCSLDFEAMMDVYVRNTPQDALETFADSLGVDVLALAEIGAARHSQQTAWAFPMRNGDGKTVGIRLRGDNGDKWAIKGSKEGLFYPLRAPEDRVAVVCEGPTDTAAALTLGLWAVGRPSCMGGIEQIKRLCQRFRIKELIVIADNDTPKPRQGGGWWQPGFDGAQKLISEVYVPCRLIAPPSKDIRAWVRSGATREDFDFLTAATR